MAASEIAICDASLAMLGIARQITSVDGDIATSTDTTVEQRLCEFWYAKERDRLLTMIPWPFARGEATLVEADDGTGEAWADEWDTAYTYPSDCLRLRRFINDTVYSGVPYNGWGDPWMWYGPGNHPWRYVVRNHASAKVIMTNVGSNDADMWYTRQITDTTLFPALFDEALEWLIASKIAMPLTSDPNLGAYSYNMFQVALTAASGSDFNEENRHAEPDGEFVRAAQGF